MDIQWLRALQTELFRGGGGDLFFLLESMITGGKQSFLSFLYQASEGRGYALPYSWSYGPDNENDPSVPCERIWFMLTEETAVSTELAPCEFTRLMQMIADCYCQACPPDSAAVGFYMEKLAARYCPPEGQAANAAEAIRPVVLSGGFLFIPAVQSDIAGYITADRQGRDMPGKTVYLTRQQADDIIESDSVFGALAGGCYAYFAMPVTLDACYSDIRDNRCYLTEGSVITLKENGGELTLRLS